MVRSCLIEPLVKPLVGRGASGRGRRSALARSRIAATCLALSALVSVSTAADAAHEQLESEALKSRLAQTVKANAHRAPKIDSKVALANLLALVAAREDEIVAPLVESPGFEQEALRHRRKRPPLIGAHRPGPDGLGLAERLDLLFSGTDPTFRLFGSGQHLSGIPTS